jgi:hypothetical protein
VDAATWIALGALAVAAIGPAVAMLTSNARRDGKVDAVLERLTKIAEDHENRLRRGRL